MDNIDKILLITLILCIGVIIIFTYLDRYTQETIFYCFWQHLKPHLLKICINPLILPQEIAKIPLLSSFALILTGIGVEKYFTPRYTFLPNSIALLLHFKEINFTFPVLNLVRYVLPLTTKGLDTFNWISYLIVFLYIMIGIIGGIISWYHYQTTRKSKESTCETTSIFAWVYSSFSVGVIIFLDGILYFLIPWIISACFPIYSSYLQF
jgi:hypothetical protein